MEIFGFSICKDLEWARDQLKLRGATNRPADTDFIRVTLHSESLRVTITPKAGTPLNAAQVQFNRQLDDAEDLIRTCLEHENWPDFLSSLLTIARAGLENGNVDAAAQALVDFRHRIVQTRVDQITYYRMTRMLVPSAVIVYAIFNMQSWPTFPDDFSTQVVAPLSTACRLAGIGGVVGCLASTYLRSGKELADIRVDRRLLRWTTYSRPFVAALLTVVAYLFLRSGVLVQVKIMDLTNPIITVLVGFLLGFNERFYTEDFLFVATQRLTASTKGDINPTSSTRN